MPPRTRSQDLTLTDLPIEVLSMIFSKLSLHELRCVIPRVCWSFRHINTEQFYWRDKTVTIKVDSACPTYGYGAFRFITATPHLMGVDLSYVNNSNMVTKLLRRIKVDCSCILSLKIYHLHPSQVDLLPETLQFLNIHEFAFNVVHPISLPRLTHFEARDYELKALESLLVQSPPIKYLSLRSGPLMDFTVLEPIKETLEKLSVEITYLQEQSGKLNNFPKLRSLCAADKAPVLSKLLVLPIKVLSEIQMGEKYTAPVFPPSALQRFFSSDVFSSLTKLFLLNSRICNEGARIIRLHCPVLKEFELLVAVTATLTNFGLTHFLHIHSLQSLEVFFIESRDWILRRKRDMVDEHGMLHQCNSLKLCPLSLEELLNYWEEAGDIYEI